MICKAGDNGRPITQRLIQLQFGMCSSDNLKSRLNILKTKMIPIPPQLPPPPHKTNCSGI